jgi:hypothetical protein
MKRLLLSVFAITMFACSLLLEQIVIACSGGEDPYDYYYSFFHNNIAGSSAYMPFYFIQVTSITKTGAMAAIMQHLKKMQT